MTEYMGSPGDNWAGSNTTESEASLNAAYGIFDEARWRRVGASDDDVARLRDAHGALSPEEQGAEGRALASAPDDEIAQALADGRDRFSYVAADFAGQTIKAVLETVGDDPAAARSALEAERAGQQRVTLVSALEEIAASDEDDDDSDDADDADES